MNNSPLEKELQQELEDAAEIVKKKYKYNPHIILRMLNENGSVLTAKKLIPHFYDTGGFKELIDCKALEYSLEAIVLQKKYAELFTDEELECCKFKLREAGYTDFE